MRIERATTGQPRHAERRPWDAAMVNVAGIG
jgi:hypothetical protein